MKLPDNLEDTQRYYNNAFITLRDKDGNFKWVYIDHWEWGEDEKGNLWAKPYVVWDRDRSGYTKAKLKDDDYRLDLPDTQYFFSGHDALYLRRMTPRTTVKATSFENTRFINPLAKAVPENFEGGLFGPDGDDNRILHWLTTLQTDIPFMGFEETRDYLLRNDEILSVPFSHRRKWCLSKAPSLHDDCVLWYRLTPVCVIRGNKGVLTTPEFRQEVIDNFPVIQIQ